VLIADENEVRQRGGEVQRVISSLEAAGTQPVAPGGSAPANDPGRTLWNALNERQHVLPAVQQQIQRDRAAWRELEVAAAAVTAQVLEDAKLILPPLDGARAGDPDLRAAYGRRATAQAAIQRYVDAATRARALAQAYHGR
jgi:hypothetical protein